MNKKIKVLITGSGGFVFSNFIRQSFHMKQNYNIVSIDKVKKSHAIHNIYVNKNHQFYIGDVSNEHFLNVIFEVEKPDIVIHGASESNINTSFIKSNVFGTQAVIDACIKWNVKKLIYISTDEVYGHLESETQDVWTENSIVNPRNSYAASKASGELLVKAAHETSGLNYIITRSCNNYGPWQDPEKFIPKIIENILENKNVSIYGSGMQIRDWIHVHDHCSALMKIIDEGDVNTIYNISSGQELPNIEVFQRICNALGKGHNLAQHIGDKIGSDFRRAMNCNKLKELGWVPQYKFNEGIIQTAQWYLNNNWFFRI